MRRRLMSVTLTLPVAFGSRAAFAQTDLGLREWVRAGVKPTRATASSCMSAQGSLAGVTGYVDEPWHARWVGRPLASRLRAAGYLDWTDLDADDVVASVWTEATT